jgi:mRNA interferase MazF
VKVGDVVFIRLPQAGGGAPKLRPALTLAFLPGPFQNVLICGVSTQLDDLQPDWDELLSPSDPDFVSSGLHRMSAVRLSYLCAVEAREIVGAIGRVDPSRLSRLRGRLAALLTTNKAV